MAFFYNLDGAICPYIPGTFPLPNESTTQFGEGVFETIRVSPDNTIPLLELHWARLERSLTFPGFNKPASLSSQFLVDQILATIFANQYTGAVRIRVSVFRGYAAAQGRESMHVIIEAWPLAENYLAWNTKGLILATYDQHKLQPSAHSNLKLNNRFPYNDALAFAKSSSADDALIYNTLGNPADSAIANVFWIKNGEIITPALTVGPIAGVMRQWLLAHLPAHGYNVQEKVGTITDLKGADEIFLSNALYGIRWVGNFSGKSYPTQTAKILYHELIAPLFKSDKTLVV